MTRIKRKAMVFLIPLLIILFLVYTVPICSTIIAAFQESIGPKQGQFTLTGNFARIGDDLVPIIKRTLIWTFGSIVPAMLIGLAAAYFLRWNFRGQKICISICLIRYSVPLIIVAACWYFMYQPNIGLINSFLHVFHIEEEAVQFFSKDRAMTSVIIARIWRSLPFAFLSFYAAIRGIPWDYIEAAAIDGADEAQQFWYIILPQLKSVALSTGIVLTVWTFLVFDIINALTGGGPGKYTTILPNAIYTEMFAMHDAGTASALSLIAIAIMCTFTGIYWKTLEGRKS